MQLQDAISKRRTVREFDARPVEQAIIDKALRAGLLAPSYNHLRQWHYVLVRDRAVRLALTGTEAMVDAVDEETKQFFANYDPAAAAMYLDAIPKQRRMMLTAPELLCVAYKPKTAVADSTRVYDLNCLASAWCCIENALLSLAEDDVFGVTFIPKNTPAVKDVLGIPQELEVAALIPFGYRAEGSKTPKQVEVKLEDALHIDRF